MTLRYKIELYLSQVVENKTRFVSNIRYMIGLWCLKVTVWVILMNGGKQTDRQMD